MRNLLYTGIFALSSLSGCISTSYIYENRTVPGIIFGKMNTMRYDLDSLSNNYAVFVMCDPNGELDATSYNDRGIHRLAKDNDSVQVEYKDKYLVRQRNKKTLDKIFVETTGPNKIILNLKK